MTSALDRSSRLASGPRAAMAMAGIASAAAWAGPAVAGGDDRSADYRLTFESPWSDPAVPGEHFSPLIGGTHGLEHSFWAPGSLATPGIEQMAETGNPSGLQNEVQIAAFQGLSGGVISGSGIDSPGATTLTFTVTESFPLASVVTMIAPSPDWFIGVHGLDLQDEGGAWRTDVLVELLPYDSGTDSGVWFTSANQDTNPPEPISAITDPGLFTPLVVGSFRFQRLVDCDGDGTFDVDQIAADPGLDADGDGELDSCASDCPADVAGDDGDVGTADLIALLGGWGGGGAGAAIAAPVDTVDIADLIGLLATWGPCN